MQHKLRISIIVVFLLLIFCNERAFAVPIHDSVCNATDLGVMPAPGLCPNSPDGDTISLFSSTNLATFNPLQFSITHCYSSPSPDVWYKLQASGSYLYVEMIGYNGLNNFFAKLHHSQGSCLSLVPLDCITSSGNTIIFSFPTPVLNGEYYLQIGGSTTSETGDFYLKMKSYNDCGGCVRRGKVVLDPAPAFGTYNAGDTVTMCATVSRWEPLSSSYLHSIVPVFGPDWDLFSLAPTIVPTGISSSNSWHWYTGIPTPAGIQSGFFFDSDNDGNPSNNQGDNGNVLSDWTGCWKIRALAPCNTNDLSVDIHLYSDAETGTSSNTFVCNPYDAIHISTASHCCPSPVVYVSQTNGCVSGSAFVIIGGASSTNFYNYTIFDTSMNAMQSYSNVMGSVTFTGLFPGQYIIQVEDISNSCSSFQIINIKAGISISIQQTNSGCVSGQGEAIVTVNNYVGDQYNYYWVNVPITDQNDSIAFNLQDGWVTVVVTDTVLGCSVMDSIYIFSEGIPDAFFDLPDQVYCSDIDSIPVQSPPISPGGFFTLVSPVAVGITIDIYSGTIFLNNTTYAPPYWIYLKYSVGTNCQDFFIDSVQIIALPNPPVATSALNSIYCIGDVPPVLSVNVGGNSIAVWYDLQTTGSGFGNTFSPPLSGTSQPQSYFYTASSVLTSNFSCISAPIVFSVNAIAPPSITTSNDTTICLGELANVSVFGCPSCTYLWSPIPTSGSQDSASFQTSPPINTNYTIVVTDQGSGCTAVDYCAVFVDESGACSLTIYSGITPNGDDHNDIWFIDGIDSLDAHVEIFNRWGQQVWLGNGYDNRTVVWKGEDRDGKALPDGTYYYLIIARDKHRNGWIELSH